MLCACLHSDGGVRHSSFNTSLGFSLLILPFMDFGSDLGFRCGNTGRSIPPIVGGCGGGFDNWTSGVDDQAIWATEDEYRNWNTAPPGEALANFNHNAAVAAAPGMSGNEPPTKKSKSSPGGDSAGSGSRSNAIGKMFFKTKLCSKFRAGVCPYITNCNFAHGTEELRKPPPNWQEIVAAHVEERGISVEQREEHQIPTVSSSDSRGESQRSYKGRHCKKFYTEEGCPFGENCTFLHDEQSRARESVAISVSPTIGSGYGVVGANQKPSNWKTRICNKWETTGDCPFGSKCHFAHGLAELHKYGGGLLETEGSESSILPETKPNGAAVKTNETIVAAPALAPSRADLHNAGVPSQRPSGMIPSPGQRPIQKWKGPDKISRIYGDWIEDIE